MLPPFGANPYARHNDYLLPKLRELIGDQAETPTLGPEQNDSPERAEKFASVKRYLENGFYHNTGHAIDKHVEAYKCLNDHELDVIIGAIYTLEDEVHDIYCNISECLNVIMYSRMVLRSSEPEIVCHHELIKRQLELSTARYERYLIAWEHFHKETAKLWAIWSEERKRARDFKDAQAGLV
ncbi:hypothetical protein DFH28DRAFT_1079927 [Melampsora americana]|nr:hypothetical protein DFH28DRAFT_1079927 [Melampsora americana]